jgi:methionyl-tRNA synthetase
VDLEALPAGHPFAIPPLLFDRIEDEQVEEWTARFGGGTANDQVATT